MTALVMDDTSSMDSVSVGQSYDPDASFSVDMCRVSRPIEGAAFRVARDYLRHQKTTAWRAALNSVFHETILMLEALRDLEEDWDSYGAERISDKAINEAKGLLRELQDRYLHDEIAPSAYRSDIKPSRVAPLSNGGVMVQWNGPRARLKVFIDPDRALHLLAVGSPGSEDRLREARNVPQSEVLRAVCGALQ